MRLIDADALKEMARRVVVKDKGAITECVVDTAVAMVEELADHMPTIDHVKHGKWIHDDFGFHCSECWAMYPEEITDEINYCPNCGARMDE